VLPLVAWKGSVAAGSFFLNFIDSVSIVNVSALLVAVCGTKVSVILAEHLPLLIPVITIPSG